MKVPSFLAEKDTILKKIINKVPEPTFISTQNVFHDLLSCVIEQQIHYRSHKNIFSKLLQKAEIITELSLENFEQFDEKALSTTKLSGRKYETVLAVLDFWQNNTLDWKNLEDTEVREKLSQIKGIGKWTIDMILLFTLERPNVFPVDDYHLKIVMTSLYALSDSKLKTQMKKVAENWSPYQSLAVKYLWNWKNFNAKK